MRIALGASTIKSVLIQKRKNRHYILTEPRNKIEIEVDYMEDKIWNGEKRFTYAQITLSDV